MGESGAGRSAVALRRATSADEDFLYDVFCTTWEQEVAAMPNPAIVQHFLRIQYTAQNERFAARYPGYERSVILYDDKPAGRLFLHRTASVLHGVDMTLLPEYRCIGIGTDIVHRLFDDARTHGTVVSLRVSRRNVRATALYGALGFRLVTMDDLDCYFEWTPELGSELGSELESELDAELESGLDAGLDAGLGSEVGATPGCADAAR